MMKCTKLPALFSALVASLVLGGCVVSTAGAPGTPPVIPLPPETAEKKEEPTVVHDGPSQIGAKHVLVSYRGAMRAAPYISRSKREAEALANQIRAKAAAGEDFGKLAKEHSDDPGSAADEGSLGTFTRDQMVPEFSDAAFGLEIGGISKVVESPFGFHVIQRTE